MKEIRHKIKDPQGIHARPAGALVKNLSGFSSKVMIKKGDKEVDAKRILGVMSLGAKAGEELIFSIEGEDEESAMQALKAFLEESL